MNKSLGINLDKDILKGGVSPSQEALDLWEADEQGEGPTLKNMKPDWNNFRSLWNCFVLTSARRWRLTTMKWRRMCVTCFDNVCVAFNVL
jgi:hypothetical protein